MNFIQSIFNTSVLFNLFCSLFFLYLSYKLFSQFSEKISTSIANRTRFLQHCANFFSIFLPNWSIFNSSRAAIIFRSLLKYESKIIYSNGAFFNRSLAIAVMTVCLPVNILFVDQQITFLCGNITTSLMDPIEVRTWMSSTWSGHL